MHSVEVIKIRPQSVMPKFQSSTAAGIDLVACIDEPITLRPQQKAVLIPSGVKIWMKDGDLAGFIYPRSSWGHKLGVVLGNGTGIIDSDYQGEVMISLINRNPVLDAGEETKLIVIEPGDRIAQLVFTPIIRPTFEEVEEFSNVSARGEGGFGSTGSKAA